MIQTRPARSLLAVAASAAFALSPSTVLAADPDLEAALAQEVVTAPSQASETAAAAPATTSVITSDDIRRHGIRSLDEALNFLSLGAFMTKPLHGQEIGARGVLMTGDYNNHVLLLVDGHAVNEPYAGAASFDRGLGVPIELVDHVEVVLGPGSVLYGSNAMLAVINVVTRRARDWSGLRIVTDSDLFTWGKVGVGVGAHIDILGRKLEVTSQVEYQTQDGPAFTFAPQVYGNDSVTGEPKRFGPGAGTGVWGGRAGRSHYFRAPAAYIRVVSGGLEVSLRGSSYQRSAPYQNSITKLSGDFDAARDYEVEDWLFADVKYRLPVSRFLTIRTRAYADMYRYGYRGTFSAAEDCYDGQVDGCRSHLDASSQWVGSETQAHVDWFATGRLVTMVGVDGRAEHVAALGQAMPAARGPATTYGGIDLWNVRLGVYGQQTAAPTRWLSLNAGVRGDVAEGYPGAISPRAAVAVTPWAGSTLKGVYSRAFRAPSSWEREYEDNYFIAARTLRPERVRTVEVSFEEQLGAHRLIFGVFRTQFERLVALDVATAEEIEVERSRRSDLRDGATIYRNTDAVEATGYNAGVQGSFASQRLRYGLNVTGARARRIAGGAEQPLTVAPTVYGNARVSYDLGGSLPTLALAAQMQSRRPADRAFDSGFASPPYAPPSLDVRAAVSGPVPLLAGLSYRFTASYAFHDQGPYVIGVIRDGSFGVAPTLNPVDRFRVGLGLTYVFDR